METADILKTQEARMSKSQMKKMFIIIIIFDIKGIVHSEFIPQGQTVNQAYYVEILQWLHEDMRRKRPELWPNDWIRHHDNAPAHKALSVKWFLAQKNLLLKRNTHPILLIWLRMTCGCFHK
jgi:hypothetical protein